MSKHTIYFGLTVMFLGLFAVVCNGADTQPTYTYAKHETKIAQVFGPPFGWGTPWTPVVVSDPSVTFYSSPYFIGSYPPVVVQGPVIVRRPWRPFLRTFIP